MRSIVLQFGLQPYWDINSNIQAPVKSERLLNINIILN